jgi:tRNA (guanine37-N1)-methyltransferase
MKVDIFTLFPEICSAPLNASMMKRAQEGGHAEFAVHNIRDFAPGKHRVTDDTPYGGGQGMLMKAEPIFLGVESVKRPESRVIVMSPQGARFDQAAARRLSAEAHLIFIAGHYEGVDHRVVEHLADEELSIGDYVLTNGAIAAVVVVDAVARLIPGVLGDENSAEEESFSEGLLEGPHYTKPRKFRGWEVPEVLLSGNHAAIHQWRHEQGKLRTQKNRPDLWAAYKANNPSPKAT